jgi:hypothetical protein
MLRLEDLLKRQALPAVEQMLGQETKTALGELLLPLRKLIKVLNNSSIGVCTLCAVVP